jgi:hypothetical protein
MNFSLGRDVDRADRAHLARCKKCRKTLARLESSALSEGLEMQGQASKFALDADLRTAESPAGTDASALYGW